MRKYGEIEYKNNQLLVVYQHFEPSLEEYVDYLDRLTYWINKIETPFYIIYDTTDAIYLSAENRTIQSKWIQENELLIEQKVLKMIFIIPTITVRLVLKAILHFSPLPCPHEVISNRRMSQQIIEEDLVHAK